MSAADKDFKPVELVYIGQRLGADGERFVAFAKLLEGTPTPERPLHYPYKKNRQRAIGAIYTGALLAPDDTIRGLEMVQFKGMLPNQTLRLQWQAEDQRVEDRLALDRMESNARRISEFEKILLPLRKQYAKHMAAYDIAGAQALETMILRTLRMSPRKEEL